MASLWFICISNHGKQFGCPSELYVTGCFSVFRANFWWLGKLRLSGVATVSQQAVFGTPLEAGIFAATKSSQWCLLRGRI
jgi:hypothetical protein